MNELEKLRNVFEFIWNSHKSCDFIFNALLILNDDLWQHDPSLMLRNMAHEMISKKAKLIHPHVFHYLRKANVLILL